MQNADKPVFILGCHKSGTSLLRNLLDGHPSLFVVPTESHFFQNTGKWVSYYSRRMPPLMLTFQEMKENLVKAINFFNSHSNEVADTFTQGKWDINLFKNSLFSTNIETLKGLSDLYISSMYKSLYRKEFDPNLFWVEKSVENNEFVLEWLQLYPEAKFIYIIRNPYANLTAIKRFRRTNRVNYNPNKGAIFCMYNSYYFLYKNKDLLPSSQFKVIRYEDLLDDPKRVMKEISDFINIPYNNQLLVPTLLGELWKGNSSYGNKFTEISNINVERWKNAILKSEISLINDFFMHVLEDYNYEVINISQSKRGEFKKGNFKDVLYNKLISYYLPTFKNNKT